MTRSSTTVTVLLDGVQILSATDADLGGPGSVAIGSFNDSSYWADIEVQ